MKQSSLLMPIVCILILVLSASCRKPDNLLTKVFSQTELETIDEIIYYFDDYVASQTNHQLTIDEAYNSFFEKIMQSSLENADGDFNMFLPAIDERVAFYQNLDRNVLLEIFEIKDTLTIILGEPRKVYSPYSFELNSHGKFSTFLKELSTRNNFFKYYYENIQAAGDISPVNYAMILRDYSNIDFSNKDERFVVIVNLLHSGKTIKIDG